MNTRDMRSGFSMITAIFVIVIMSSIGALIANMGGKVVKITTDEYQHAQAELYAKSYTTYAIMAVEAHDRSSNCVRKITSRTSIPHYTVRTFLSYIGPASVISKCSVKHRLDTHVTTSQTPLTVIIDAYVDYPDPDNPSLTRTVHRRTIQKI